MAYIPKFLKTYPEYSNIIHRTLYGYFHCEVYNMKKLHSWLKYPINEISEDEYEIYMLPNEKKVEMFLEDYPMAKLISQKYLGSRLEDGVIVRFRFSYYDEIGRPEAGGASEILE